jgi:HAD superfamily hydrolase (TIGR01509 family)
LILIKGLFVDLDGTLADSIPFHRQVFFDFLSKLGLTGTEEEFNSYVGCSLIEIVKSLKKRYSLMPEEEWLHQKYSQMVLNNYASGIKVMSGATKVLLTARQRGVKLVLVTAANQTMAHQFLAVNELEDVFDILVCVKPGERGKPDPALYLRALKESALQACEVVAVEDSVNGIKSARAADCQVLWLTSENVLSAEKVYQVKDWPAVGRWINR